MDKFIIRPHSIVDIITNSSTVIYTGVTDNAVEAVKGIINDVLQSVGSDKTADDLYDIDVVSLDELEKLDEGAYESKEEYWRAYDNLQHDIETNLTKQVEVDFVDSSSHVGANIVVTSKIGSGKEISDLLAKIFLVREDYG